MNGIKKKAPNRVLFFMQRNDCYFLMNLVVKALCSSESLMK